MCLTRARELTRARYADLEAGDVHLLPNLLVGITTAITELCAEGEAVMLCTPLYPPFLLTTGYNGRKVTRVSRAASSHAHQIVDVPLVRHQNRLTFDLEAMEDRVTRDVKVPTLRASRTRTHNTGAHLVQPAQPGG